MDALSSNNAQISDAVSALRKAVRSSTRDLDRLRKALDALNAAGALGRLDLVHTHLAAVRAADLTALHLEEQRAILADQLGALHDRERSRARSHLLRELTELARAKGDEVSVLGDTPLTVALAPLTVEIDVAGNTASVGYARQEVATCDAVAREILKTCAAARDTITSAAVPSAEFFTTLRQAYRMTLVARGLRPGDRLDLVDLLLPLALLRVDVGAWHKTALPKLTPFPRYLLAYQLYRLRRDGCLVTDGLRVELGTATGGSTRDKRRVLYLPTTPTDGQYHLSIRFTPA